jgi:hypothetical protein
MDFEKIVKFIESYGRDYITSMLKILSSPWSKGEEVSDLNGRTLSFAFINLALGIVLYSATRDVRMPGIGELTVAQIAVALFLWCVFAAIAHGLARVFGSKKPFLLTLELSPKLGDGRGQAAAA